MIKTSRLFVRPLRAEEYSDYARLEIDPRVRQFTGPPLQVSVEQYRRFMSSGSDTALAVCAENLRFIGRCGFRAHDGRVEYLYLRWRIARALPRVAQCALFRISSAMNRANALTFVNFPAALLLPSLIARRSHLNDSCPHELWLSNMTYRVRVGPLSVQ